jgi:hypothetical protein
MAAVQNANGPAEAATSPDHGSTKTSGEIPVNVHTNITERGRAATAKEISYAVLNAVGDAEISLHLMQAATLLFRDLIIGEVKDGAATICEDNAKMLHTLVDLAWSRSSDLVDRLADISEAAR